MATISVCGIVSQALLDSGSQMTTIAESYYHSALSQLPLGSMDDFGLTLYGPDGREIPYLGYVWAEFSAPFMGSKTVEVPALVVPTTEYNLKVPGLIGTNVFNRCQDQAENNGVPEEWKTAFLSLQNGLVGYVKSTNERAIEVQPFQTVTLSGLLRKNRDVETAITEPTENASDRIGVCPRTVTIDAACKTQRVPVRIFNISAKVLSIPPKATLCEMQEVKILRHFDIEKKEKEQSAGINSQLVDQQKTEMCLPDGINLDNAKLSEEEKEKATQVFSKWDSIFSKGPTDIGRTKLVEHRIDLTDDRPFKEPHRHIPPALIEEVREHLQEMLNTEVIKESSSPYSSNVVIVRKKDGTIRFCVDFRRLNNKTIKDAYAIPRVEDTLHLLSGAKYFSKIDLRSRYWQVEICEADKHKTAFQVGTLGFYEFNRMPFGLCNAPASFQRLMERCMGDMNLRDCLIYLDDVIIFSATFKEHLDRLEAVFTRLQENNLKLKASKCKFFKSQVTYLGHVVSDAGIQTDSEKLEALKSWPVPKNVKEVRSYLGFTGYYRRFVKNYARIARPLNDLLVGHCTNNKSKGKKPKTKVSRAVFEWTDSHQKAFESLKEKLASPPVLAYADYQLPFKLHTDASNTGLGAVLYQNQGGLDRVIAYASRSLKTAEKNYPAHKLEFLALKWAVTEKFHDYLYGMKFEAVTDNNPLTYILTSAKLDATGQRWVAALSSYNFNLTYRRGLKNADADGMSRLPRHDNMETNAEHHKTVDGHTMKETINIKMDKDEKKSATDDMKKDQEETGIDTSKISTSNSNTETNQQESIKTEFPDVLKAISYSINAEVSDLPLVDCLTFSTELEEEQLVQDEVLSAASLKNQDWIKAQEQDEQIRKVKSLIESNLLPKQRKGLDLDIAFWRDLEKFQLIEGLLYRKSIFENNECLQLVIPQTLRDTIFKAYHDDLGHQGRDRTLSLIKRRFFWPYMDNYVQDKVRQCVSCIKRKVAPTRAADLVSIESHAPMEVICIDFLKLERSKGGYENILVITDHFTRYAQAVPTRNQTATTTARALFDGFFVHYGFPAKIHSDQGANFESRVIKKLCKISGIKKTRTTPYHPMGNGMCERFNRTLLNMLGTLTDRQKVDWKAYVPTLTHAYNAATHASTGYAPFYLMFGRYPRLSVDAFLGLWVDSSGNNTRADYVDKLKSRLIFAYKAATKEAAKSAERQKTAYDQRVRNAVVETGDRALVRSVGLKGPQKLANKWEDQTYLVTKQPIPGIPVYVVQKEGSTAKPRTLHRNMLLPFNSLPILETELPLNKRSEKEQLTTVEESSNSSCASSTDSSSSDSECEERCCRPEKQPSYVIPQRRGKASLAGEPPPQQIRRRKKQPPLRRGIRERRAPERFQAGNFEHVFYVNPENIIQI